MQILEHVYQVPGVVANLYIVEDADGLTLIDAGLDVLNEMKTFGEAAVTLAVLVERPL